MDRKVYLEEVDEFTYGYETILVKDFQMGEKLKMESFAQYQAMLLFFLVEIIQYTMFQHIHLDCYVKKNLKLIMLI